MNQTVAISPDADTILSSLHHHPTIDSHEIRPQQQVKRPPTADLSGLDQPRKQQKLDPKLASPSKTKSDLHSLGHLLSWRDQTDLSVASGTAESSKTLQVPRVEQAPLDEFAENVQAIFINASWERGGHPGLTLERFSKLRLSDRLMNNGILFIWAEKDNMSPIMDHLETMGFVYVEIFSFILLSANKLRELEKSQPVKKTKNLLDFFQKKEPKEQSKTTDQLPQKDYFSMEAQQFPNIDPNNLISNQDYEYFKKGKKNLLLLRKINKAQPLQLRHQRTSDVYFTLFDQNKGTIDDKGYDCLYKMIETLLIKANYKEGQPLKMMELWARKNHSRIGWVSVAEQDNLY